MAGNSHGDWIWYEVMTSNPQGARAFYEKIVGWKISPDQGEPEYAMIEASEGMVGGMLTLTKDMTDHGARPCWLGYIAVDDVDKTVKAIVNRGGKELMPARDIPQGRFAMVADPQGAPFYVMKPVPPADNPEAKSMAFAGDRPMQGHCAWNELATSDPAAALHFYTTLFGWVKDGEMDMGEGGKYEFLRHRLVIGALMRKPPQMPASFWTFYFRVSGIDATVERVRASGGQVMMGPHEVPGGDWIIVGTDPQGATFAMVGSK